RRRGPVPGRFDRPDRQARPGQSQLPPGRPVSAGRCRLDRLQPEHPDPVWPDRPLDRRAAPRLFRQLPRPPRSGPLMHLLMPVLAEASANIQYKLARLQTLTEWWHWLVLFAASVAIVVFVTWMYIRDSVELPRGLAVTLCLLRLVA